ncbi:hypothetical protein P368_02315 [Comamonas thiooxydans]|nr:hypothetical protein P365_02315 [Comamonas thiooxydans]KGH16181.1 hypothetical protein P368_02315 [Comamonas thiooxydans]
MIRAQELYQSLARGRGIEMHAHKQFTVATDNEHSWMCDDHARCVC